MQRFYQLREAIEGHLKQAKPESENDALRQLQEQNAKLLYRVDHLVSNINALRQ